MCILHIMSPNSPPISAVELKQWRLQQSLSQEQVGEKLGVSHSAVNRWEKSGEDDQSIPGPADKLLRMLIRGEMPVELPTAGLGSQVREDIGAVEMTVEAFEECLRRARAAGFGSVTEWIAGLVRAELRAGSLSERLVLFPARRTAT
jgi:transcriptional regulator with XRE-family HTH domain